jgi:hypothetical protein
VVALEDVVVEMDVPNDSGTSYLNRRTGQFVTTDESGTLLDGQEVEGLPDLESDDPTRVADVLDSVDWVALPDKCEIHEYRLMERFSLGVEDPDVRAALLQAIRGRGAFRRFKDVLHERGMAEAWYTYRHQSLEAIAVEWLEASGIAYSRGKGSRSEGGA